MNFVYLFFWSLPKHTTSKDIAFVFNDYCHVCHLQPDGPAVYIFSTSSRYSENRFLSHFPGQVEKITL